MKSFLSYLHQLDRSIGKTAKSIATTNRANLVFTTAALVSLGCLPLAIPQLVRAEQLLTTTNGNRSGTGPTQQQSGLEIIFVDAAVGKIEAYLPKGSSHQVVHELHSKNPLAEMAQVLRSYHDVKAIHIISHGQTGQLILGGQHYDAATLKNYQSELKLIGQSLRSGGDILLYGCNIGKTPELIATLAQLTGADIAASNNPTGDTAQGGDWRLEVANGVIETAAIAVPEWQGLLWTTPAVETVGWFGDTPALTPNATILSAGPFSSAGANIGAPSHAFSVVKVTVPSQASVQKLQNVPVTTTTFAQAQTNNDYFYSDLTVGSTGLLITMQYNQVSSTYNAASAKMGVSITDTTSGGSEVVLNSTGVNLQGSGTLLNVPLNSPGSQLIPGHTYRVKFYMWGCGSSQTCYVDNPKFYTQLNEAPTAKDVTATSQANPGGTTRVQVPALNGTDPEDGTLGTGKSFRIVALPTNGTLYYNGVAVTANQAISSYDPTLLTLDPTATGTDTVNFTYKAIDSLTAESAAATVSMPFTAIVTQIVVNGKVFSDADANVVLDGSDAGTNAGSANLTVYAIGTASNVVAKATVAANGTYSLTNVPASSTVTLRLSNDSTVALGATAPTAPSLPIGWFNTGENLNGTIDPAIDTLGDIALTTATTDLTNENFGIRPATTIAADPAPVTCNAYSTALNTGYDAAGQPLGDGASDLNWTAEWIDGPLSGIDTPYSKPRPVGPMPAVVFGSSRPSPPWVAETGARWITYPFRLSTNSNGTHTDADFDGRTFEGNSGFPLVGTTDAVRLKFTSKVTLPNNTSTIGISLPVGVAVDNQFVSIKVNGVENIGTTIVGNPFAADFSAKTNISLNKGWGAGVNIIEIVVDSAPGQVGFFLGVNASATPICPTKANVLMVKRVTAINGDSVKNPNDVTKPLNLFIDDTSPLTVTNTTPLDDNNCNWPGSTGTSGACTNTYIKGALAPGKVKPGDEIEYTIYYLNAGNNKASARVCDRLSPNLAFQPNFDLNNVAKGIGFNPGNTGITYLTNLGTDGDKGQLTDPASVIVNSKDTCNLPSNGGTEVVVVDVGDVTTPLLGSTGAGVPTGSYGYIRFKAVVK